MHKKTKIMKSIVITLALFICWVICAIPAEVKADSNLVAVEGVSYNVNTSLVDNLKPLMGKKVCVTLDSGKTFTGIVKSVGEHLVHLEKLEGKEYFDALIRIETISAIDTRFLTEKR